MFGVLIAGEWIAGMGAALWISPRAWAGTNATLHPHVIASIALGGIISVLPVVLAFARPGHMVIMQALARHSDPRLTLGRYTHTDTNEQSVALALLTDLSAALAVQCATGTDDALAGDLADCLAQKGTESSNSVHPDAVYSADTYGEGDLRLAPEITAFGEESRAVSQYTPVGSNH